MDTQHRITEIYESIKNNLKNKNDPNTVQQLKKDIQNIEAELSVFGKENHDTFIKSLAMEAYLATLSIKVLPYTIVEKKNILQNIFNKLKPFVLKEPCLYIFLRVQNMLCSVLIHLDQTILAREILENMENIYDKINQSETNKFIDAEELFTKPLGNIKPMDPDKIDKVVTNNIQMQAYLYNKLNLSDKYALYSHTALRRQLEMKDGTPKDWALRVARLGNYFTYLNQMGNARHHLCAAYYVLRAYHDNSKLIGPDSLAQRIDIENHFQELSHHWVKYGLTLFKLSKKVILGRFFTKHKDDPWQSVILLQDKMDPSDKEDDPSKDAITEKEDYFTERSFNFPSLNLSDMESKVPLDLVSKPEDTRRLFSFTYKWLKRTRHYYDFENHSAEHIACSLQLAELYEHMAFFEKDIEKQYTIQKKRADVLEALSALLKSSDGMVTVHIDVIRELSQVQLELMALNLQKLWHKDSSLNAMKLDYETASDSFDLCSVTDTLRGSSRNLLLKKMEAAAAINGKLFRLSGQLSFKSLSQVSFMTEV